MTSFIYDRITSVSLVGGVGCNKYIQNSIRDMIDPSLPLYIPPPSLLRDNGAMVAWVGIER